MFSRYFDLPFVSDPEAQMMRNYGAFGEQTTKRQEDRRGIRSTVVVGPNGKFLNWPEVGNAEEHPQEVITWPGLKVQVEGYTVE